MRISPNFDLSEFTTSQTAARLGISNVPPGFVIENLAKTAELLEEVRKVLGKPILISSGYRSREVNAAVGGAANSAHLTGQAADFTSPGAGSPMTVASIIAGTPGLEFDQLILEFPPTGWVHIAWRDNPRQQILTIDRNGTREGL